MAIVTALTGSTAPLLRYSVSGRPRASGRSFTRKSDTPSFDGRFYSFPEVGFSPLPPENKVPVWVGGDSDAAFRRTVKYGDAFHAAFQSIEKVPRRGSA